MTPLLTAAANNGYESVILLIHHGANINAKDCDGFDASYLAKQKGHT
ncbi:ankyrin repeat domain-containing protein [Candidatus Phycorickettsia trachydisci]